MVNLGLRPILRSLRRDSTFTITATVTLALGIGATTAMFSVVEGVLLRPLPFPAPDRLVTLTQRNPPSGVDRNLTSLPNLNDWRLSPQFAALGGYYRMGAALAGAGEPEQLTAAVVTAGFFETLRIPPAQGRVFASDEHTPGREFVAVLGHALWQKKFGADTRIAGRTVTLNSTGYTIVGVMPRTFAFPGDVDLWLPLAPSGAFVRLAPERGAYWLRVIGRLRDGTTRQAAQRDLDAVAARLASAYPQTNTGLGVNVESMHEHLVGRSRPALLLLFGLVAGVLLIACANVANLLLARGSQRQRDMAVRRALGAGGRQLVRHLLGEALVLSAAGGIGGLLLAYWGVSALAASAPPDLPRLGEARINAAVLAFASAISVLTALLFGLAPAVQTSSGSTLDETLKGSGKGVPDRSRGRRLRNGLVVAEVALAALPLVGAGLLVRSFMRLVAVDPGFRAERVLTMRVTLPRNDYADPAQVRGFVTQLLDRVSALHGVASASASGSLMFTRTPVSSSLAVAGRPMPASGTLDSAVMFDSVTPQFFRTLGIPLRRGRTFTPDDTDTAPRVAVVNEALARRVFAGEDAVGRRVTLEDPANPKSNWYEIVGVVGDVHRSALDQTPTAEIYLPLAQQPARSLIIAIEAAGDPGNLARAAVQSVWALDPHLPVSHVAPLTTLMAESLQSRRVTMLLSAGFGLLALVLAAVGVYGVIAYATNQRRQEIGIRIALGARPADVRRLVLRDGLLLVLTGLLAGLAGAVLLSRAMTGLLFGIGPFDPLTFAAIALVLLGTAALAAYLPARHASRIDPQAALRAP